MTCMDCCRPFDAKMKGVTQLASIWSCHAVLMQAKGSDSGQGHPLRSPRQSIMQKKLRTEDGDDSSIVASSTGPILQHAGMSLSSCLCSFKRSGLCQMIRALWIQCQLDRVLSRIPGMLQAAFTSEQRPSPHLCTG